MDKIKVGDKLKIECFKHNGFLDQTSEEATVVFVSEEMLVVANDRTKLIEHNGESHCTGEPAVLFSSFSKITVEETMLSLKFLMRSC